MMSPSFPAGQSTAGWAAASKSNNGAAVIPGTNAHQTTHDMGAVVLDAYRGYGVDAMRRVVKSYQGGYNAKATALGTTTVDWEQIRNGIGLAFPPMVTDEEEEAIPAAM